MNQALIVVDDFYDDPDALVARARGLAYRREPGVNYPGLTADTFQDVPALMKRFATLLGGIEIKYRGAQGTFRIATEDDLKTRVSTVHIDSSDWSAVIYLNRAPLEGTSFYRHRRLDLTYVSPEQHRRPEVQGAIARDTLDPDAWEHLYEIPMKYNRLVIFDGKYFHSGARGLPGAGAAEGRMTQNFFFHRA